MEGTISRLDKIAEMAGLDFNDEGDSMLLLIYDDDGVTIASLGNRCFIMSDGLLVQKNPNKKGFVIERSQNCAIRVVAGKKTRDSIFVAFQGEQVDFSPNGTPSVRVGHRKDQAKKKKKRA